MSPENKQIPSWAVKERERDLRWIQENYEGFVFAASLSFQELGRGAIVVDTTIVFEGGHPLGYFPQQLLEAENDEDVKRMVRTYDPKSELVIYLLKPKNRTSCYRLKQLR